MVHTCVWLFLGGPLGQDHAAEYQSAAQKLHRTEHLIQEKPTGQYGEHRFQAHDQRSRSGRKTLLTQDLQGIGHAGGQDTCIKQRNSTGQNVFPDRSFRQEHHHRGNHGVHQELNAVQPKAVQRLSQPVNQGNLNGEGLPKPLKGS